MLWLNRHRRLRDNLSAYADGRLSPDATRSVEGHLETCGACRGELEDLRAAVALLRALPEAETPRSFALTPDQIARPQRRAPVTGLPPLVTGLRLASVALAVSLAAVVIADVGGLAGNSSGPGVSDRASHTLSQNERAAAAVPSPGIQYDGTVPAPTSGGVTGGQPGGPVPAGGGAGVGPGTVTTPPPLPSPGSGTSSIAAITPPAVPTPAGGVAGGPAEGGGGPTGVQGGALAQTPPAPSPVAGGYAPAVPGQTVAPAVKSAPIVETPPAGVAQTAAAQSGGGGDTLLIAEIALAVALVVVTAAGVLLAKAMRR